MSKKIFLIVIKPVIYFALSFLIAFCSTKGENTTEPLKYSVTKPIIVDTFYTNEYVAEIQSVQNVEVRARVKGYLEYMYIDEGKHVVEGQKLFSINSAQYKEELSKAKALLKSAIAEAKTAEIEVKNVQILVDKNVVAKTELEMAQAKLEAANAKVEEAKSNESSAALNLSLTEIKAPFDGIINRIPNKAGSLIDEGTLLTTISDNKDVYAYFNVSEKEYLDLKMQNNADNKNEVTLLLANNKPYPIKGYIETVEGEFDKTTGNIAFRARFANPEGILKHGASGKIQLKLKLNKVLIIPQKSTFEIQDKYYVFTVNKNNVAEMKNFIPKSRLPYLFVVSKGLNTSDKIIYEGIQLIKHGDKITPEIVSLKEMIMKEANQNGN